MKKISILLKTVLFMGCLTLAGTSQAVDDRQLKKYEIGGQFTILRRTDASTVAEAFRVLGSSSTSADNPPSLTELGVGGRFTYNFTKNLGMEAEVNFFPDDKKSDYIIGVPVPIAEPGGRKFQAVFGPKFGFRKNKFGIFGKVRPGLIRFDKYEIVTEVGATPQSFYVFSRSKEDVTFFNLDVGGVFEYYPSRSTVFRIDVGDTIIRYGRQEPREINADFTRHNFQTSFGFGFRF